MSSNVRPTATHHWPTRISDCGADLRHRQRLVGLDLQQHDLAVVVGGHQLGRLARAVGQPHQDRGRLVDEVEGAGDDVAVRIDDQPGGRPGAEQHVFTRSRPPMVSMRTTPGRHAIDGGDERLLLQRIQVVAGRRRRGSTGRKSGEAGQRCEGRETASRTDDRAALPSAAE